MGQNRISSSQIFINKKYIENDYGDEYLLSKKNNIFSLLLRRKLFSYDE
jgi:hypothetical protein